MMTISVRSELDIDTLAEFTLRKLAKLEAEIFCIEEVIEHSTYVKDNPIKEEEEYYKDNKVLLYRELIVKPSIPKGDTILLPEDFKNRNDVDHLINSLNFSYDDFDFDFMIEHLLDYFLKQINGKRSYNEILAKFIAFCGSCSSEHNLKWVALRAIRNFPLNLKLTEDIKSKQGITLSNDYIQLVSKLSEEYNRNSVKGLDTIICIHEDNRIEVE